MDHLRRTAECQKVIHALVKRKPENGQKNEEGFEGKGLRCKLSRQGGLNWEGDIRAQI